MEQHQNKKYNVLTLPLVYTQSFLDLSEAEIKDYYDWFLKIKNERLTNLCNFLFGDLENCLAEKKLNVIETFLLNSVSVRQKPIDQFNAEYKEVPLKLRPVAQPDNYVLTEQTISVCYDIGIYLGELIIQIDSEINWALETDDMYSDYGQPVLAKRNAQVKINPFRVAKNAAAKIHEGKYKDGQLLGFFNAWKKAFKV